MAGASTEEIEKPDTPTNTTSIDKQREQTNPNNKEISLMNDIAPEVLIKHPLQNEWTLWYLEMDRSRTWEEMQNEITSFNTVEDFWSIYNHIKLASEIKVGNDYSIFKKNIRPMWEDDANKRGGRWVITFSNKMKRNELDNVWLDVVLCIIGEAFEYSDEICGAVVNIRNRGDKVSLWTADGGKQQAIMEIGKKLKENLRLSPEVQIQYQLHKDAAVKTTAKPIYVI